MNHIDLFSGIGGFALAAREVWGEEYNNLFFCDNNQFCQEVIRKNFGKDSLIYGDIREVTKERFIADTKRFYTGQSSEQEGRENTERGNSKVDLLTGGFPCQPFSCAGKRKGTNDDRHLWPEMLRVIQDFKPIWVIAENVRGLLTIEGGLVFEQVCLDLEREGYEVQPFIIPAVAVNAPHRRDRVWIVAHRNGQRGRTQEHDNNKNRTESDKGRQGQSQYRTDGQGGWTRNWLEVATRLCSVDDGLPARMGKTTISKARHRIEQLKAYGNAIVPQVAIEIMKGIRSVEKTSIYSE